jgi:phosphoglycerate dehydrogenase-like enzyme
MPTPKSETQPAAVNILITIPLDENQIQKLRGISPRLQINVIPTRRAEEIPANVWEKTDVLYTDTILPNPGQAPLLRWIQFHWAGIDRLADTQILKEPNLLATTLSGASASQMAEFILTGLLALGHHLTALAASQRNTEWPADRWERFSPRELRGSTVGIVGYGSIGRQTARLLQSFGATVLAAKRDAKHPEDKGYTPEGLGDPEGNLARRIYPYQALPSMLKDCDFVVIAAPLTSETRGMIGSDEITAMKQGAYLVDVSRGGIVDHTALTKALKSGKLGGALLDVFPQEPLAQDSPLWKMPNVIITPHISGNSPFYTERAIELFSENIHRYLGNLPLYNQFNPEVGY